LISWWSHSWSMNSPTFMEPGRSPLDLILNQLNPIHTLPPYFCKIHFNIILPSTPNLSSGFFHLGFQSKILSPFLIFPCVLHFLSGSSSCYFLCLRPKYSPQHSVLKMPSSDSQTQWIAHFFFVCWKHLI
jgi:hypothetical protein